ncbi:methionine-S-sulfoxide reductase [Peribacillus deserti]|uniref:Peptide methionine sulfoxide reductase MsrA n=1 Tax=Peribacillus deserti TaxID=673318 RepID=A0ABS2QK49_9BACI|nr:methionine-S-sulfoxide reductase [Peribacillus deserti]
MGYEMLELATFAGGCFWCMVSPFEERQGIHSVVSGYTGGRKKNPTYKEVKSGTTDHYEAVQIVYNPLIISYKELVEVYWQQIDPTDSEGQFTDRGSSYKSVIFYHNEVQRIEAEGSRLALMESGRFKNPIVTEILPASEFFRAEEYHQDFHKKNPFRYALYRRARKEKSFRGNTGQKTGRL